MAQLVTIFGGSGFVGRYIARRLAKQGWRIRVAVRRPNEALFVKPYGAVGQVEPVLCNIRDDLSVRAAMQGADAVINCVGTFDRGGKNNFDAVQVRGASRIARIAREEGVGRLVHISAIGADPHGPSHYAVSKGEGEAAILSNYPGAVILRPSVIFGTEDKFLNRFAGMTKMGPILPLIGGKSRFQPVYVEDVAKAAVKAANGDVPAGIYELGGPDVLTLREIVGQILSSIYRRRLVINLPLCFAITYAAMGDHQKNAERAARDLGAPEWKVLTLISAPMLAAPLAAAFFLSVTFSWDEFIVAFLLTRFDVTLPVEIWSMLRSGLSPRTNAIGALVFLVSIAIVVALELTLFRKART